MAVNGVLRPGFIQLRVLDMGEALVHYRDRLGMFEVSTGDDGRVQTHAARIGLNTGFNANLLLRF